MDRENPSERQKISQGARKPMSTAECVADELQGKVKRLAFPAQPGESIKGCLNRVARRAGVTTTEAKRLWYREWRRVPADVADRVRDAVERHERQLEQDFPALKARFWALTHGSSDPEFYLQRCAEAYPPADLAGRKAEAE